MRNWNRKLAIFALLLILPLQGMAAALMPIACFSSPAHATGGNTQHPPAAAHGHHAPGADAHAGHAHDSSEQGEGNAAGYNGHLCCHLFSALPATEAVVTAAGLPQPVSTAYTSAALFIPEQPQRPPRT